MRWTHTAWRGHSQISHNQLWNMHARIHKQQSFKPFGRSAKNITCTPFTQQSFTQNSTPIPIYTRTLIFHSLLVNSNDKKPHTLEYTEHTIFSGWNTISTIFVLLLCIRKQWYKIKIRIKTRIMLCQGDGQTFHSPHQPTIVRSKMFYLRR